MHIEVDTGDIEDVYHFIKSVCSFQKNVYKTLITIEIQLKV